MVIVRFYEFHFLLCNQLPKGKFQKLQNIEISQPNFITEGQAVLFPNHRKACCHHIRFSIRNAY